jgi:hypothetical protein
MKRSCDDADATAMPAPSKAPRVDAPEAPAFDGAHSVELTGELTDAQVVAALLEVGGPQLDGLAVKTTTTLGAAAAAALGAVEARVLDVAEAAIAGDAVEALRGALSTNGFLRALRTADPEAFADLDEARAAHDLAPLSLNDDDDEEDEDDDEDGVYCDGEGCEAVLVDDAAVFTDGASDYCGACAARRPGGPELRETTARARVAEVAGDDDSDGGDDDSDGGEAP